jgi:1,4-alpha-glucan branching enzyme
VYGFTENFMLPLSHDEVVYGKRSILRKMPGDDWQQFANLRLLYSYMFTHSGTKLLFMGDEFGQSEEWDYKKSLDWHLLEYDSHRGVSETIKALNKLYKTEPALYEKTFTWNGFEWIDGGNADDSILVYRRIGNDPKNDLVIILNMTPVPRKNYRIGVPKKGTWKEIFNSDSKAYWGSGLTNPKPLKSEAVEWQWKKDSVVLTIPPLGAVVLKEG